MFGLFKSKPQEEKLSESGPVIILKVVGIRYFDKDVDIPDSVLEDYFNQLQKIKNRYTFADIEKLNSQAGFDLTKGIAFLEDKERYQSSIQIRYIFEGLMKKGEKGISTETAQAIKDSLLVKRPLTRVDIQSIAQEVGCDIYGRCKWKTIIQLDLVNESSNLTFYIPKTY